VDIGGKSRNLGSLPYLALSADCLPPLADVAHASIQPVQADTANAGRWRVPLSKYVANMAHADETKVIALQQNANEQRGAKVPNMRTARQVFDVEFLSVRAKLLEVAASLDRIDRCEGSLSNDARRTQVQAAIQVLLRPEDDRAEQIQLIFSRPYEHDWRENLGVE
jgi:hypothetical protein